MAERVTIPPELRADFAAETAAQTASGVWAISLIAFIIFPVTTFFDAFMYPEHLRALSVVRFSASAAGLALLLVIFRARRAGTDVRHARRFTWAFIVICCVGLDGLILVPGGPESPYYAGITLLLLAILVAMPFGLAEMTGIQVFIIVQFDLFMLLCDRIDVTGPDGLSVLQSYVNANYFFLSTTAIGLFGTAIRHRLRVLEFLGRHQLQGTNLELQDTLEQLRTAQDQIITQERLASLGSLTAGIAHEIQNPLNFVNNFSELSVELIEDLEAELNKVEGVESELREEIDALVGDLCQNLGKIHEHGSRADSIVKSMLAHSRGEAGERESADLNALVDDAITLVYHSRRGQESMRQVEIVKELDSRVGEVPVVVQNVNQVLLHLLNNGCYAASQQAARLAAADPPDDSFVPQVQVRTVSTRDWVEVRVRDNGTGIPGEVLDKIFNPFFTTKPTGEGTGLGLSIAYDIVTQIHQGELTVESKLGHFTEFCMRLPRSQRARRTARIVSTSRLGLDTKRYALLAGEGEGGPG